MKGVFGVFLITLGGILVFTVVGSPLGGILILIGMFLLFSSAKDK